MVRAMEINCDKISLRNDDRILVNDSSINVKFFELKIAGKNGSGKSTFIRKLVKGNLNNLRINQEKSTAFLKRVGYVYIAQKPVLVSELNIKEHASLYGVQYREVVSKLHDLELRDLEKLKVKNMSGGEQQCVYICLMLVKKKAGLIILDEPFNNLSECNREKIAGMLEKDTRPKIIVDHTGEYSCDSQITIKKRKMYVS